MKHWRLAADASKQEQAHFPDLATVFSLEGERIAKDPLSQVFRLRLDGQIYYLKRYFSAGKRMRRWLGRPRVKAEWQNLQQFAKWGIPTAELVGWGLQRGLLGQFLRGALITREVANSTDLSQLWQNHDPRLADRAWVRKVSQQVADATRIMHSHRFAHNDLKWRNILVDKGAQIHLIDCPSGTFWRGPVLRQRIIKDLACLDKIGNKALSRTQRLRFYLSYCNKTRLEASDRPFINSILNYYEGRV